MSFVPRPGGEAARAGPPYEDSAIIGFLVEILRGNAISFTLEGPRTPDAFEGQVARSSGIEWIQCKRSAHDAGGWTVRRLREAGVLDALMNAARGGSRARFITDQRSVIGELADIARQAPSADEWTEAVTGRSQAIEGGLEELKALTRAETADLWPILRRLEIRTIDAVEAAAKAAAQLELAVRPGHLSDTDAVLRRALSAEFVATTITAERIREVLDRDCPGWRPVDLEIARQTVNGCTRTFVEERVSQRHGLPSVSRRVTAEIVELVRQGQHVVVTGPAGFGKSEVLAQVVEQLGDQAPVLAISAEDISATEPGGLNRQLGLTEVSPLVALAGNDERPGLLVVDQVDSASPALGGDEGRWRSLVRLVVGARHAGISVVLAARPIDARSAPGWESMSDVSTVTVPPFDADEQESLLGEPCGLPPALAVSPLLCSLWASSGGAARGVTPGSASEVITAYRQYIQRTCRLTDAELVGVEADLLVALDRARSSAAPLSATSGHPDAANRLLTAGYLRSANGRVGFGHEVVLDHVWAAAFVRSGRDVGALVIAGDLVAARQAQRLLDFVADDPNHVAETFAALLAPQVRSHLVAATLWWLRSRSAPGVKLWRCLRQTLDAGGWRRTMATRVIRENRDLILLAFDDQWIGSLLAEEQPSRDLAAWIASNAPPELAPAVASVYRTAAVDKQRQLGVLRLGADTVGAETGDLFCTWIAQLDDDDELDYDIQRALTANPVQGTRMLAARIGRLAALAHDETAEGLLSWRSQGRNERRDGLVRALRWSAHHQPQTFVEVITPIVRQCESELRTPTRSLSYLMTRSVIDGVDEGPAHWTGWLIQSLLDAHRQLGSAHLDLAASTITDQTPLHADLGVGILAATLTGLPADEVELAVAGFGRLFEVNETWSPWSARLVAEATITWRERCDPEWLQLCSEQLHGEHAQSVVDALQGRDPDLSAPSASIFVGFVGPPEPPEVIGAWSNDEWIDALLRYPDDDTHLDGSGSFVGGRFQLSQQLGDAAKTQPSRFSTLAGTIAARVHPDYLWSLIRGLAGSDLEAVDVDSVLRIATAVEPVDIDAVAWFSRRAAELGHSSPTLRATLEAVANGRHDPTISFAGDEDGDDIVWLNRADTSALAGLVILLTGDPGGESTLADLTQLACAERDRPRMLALLWGLAHWVPESPRVAQQMAEEIVTSSPAVAASQAARRLSRLLARRQWPIRQEVWDHVLVDDAGKAAVEAGRWWIVNRLDGDAAFHVELHQLSSGGRRGAALEVAEAVHHNPKPLAVEALARLIEDEDPDVQRAAASWAHRFGRIQFDGAERLELTARHAPLIRPTVLRPNGRDGDLGLLAAFAELGSDQATEALNLLAEILEYASPDRTFDMVAHDAIEVAYAAHEALPRTDRGRALDLIDRVIERDPVPTIERLRSFADASPRW